MGLADDIINSKNSKSTNDETKINKVNLTQKQDKLINGILNVSPPKIKQSSNTMNLNSKIKDNNLITNKNSNDVNKYTSDGYRITNKKYGDYFYQNYATDKDKPIVEKDGYYYIFDENSNGNGRYKSVDSMNFLTTKEADKQQYEEAQKQGYIGSNNTDLKKISNQIKLDTIQLSEDEKEEYKNSLSKKEQDENKNKKDKDDLIKYDNFKTRLGIVGKNISKIPGTVVNTTSELGKSIGDFAESVGDTMLQIGSSKYNPFMHLLYDGNVEDGQKIAQEIIKEDASQKLFDETLGYQKVQSNGKTLQQNLDDNSYVKSDNLGGTIVRGIGNMLPSIALGNAGAGNIGSMISMGINSYGSGIDEAYNEGATRGQANLYGLGNAGLEMATEWVTGGIPGVKKIANISKNTKLGKVANFINKLNLDTIADKGLDKISNKIAKEVLNAGYKMIGEGGEEALSEWLNPFLKNAIYSSGEKPSGSAILESFIVGAITGGILEAPINTSNIKNAINETLPTAKVNLQEINSNINSNTKQKLEINNNKINTQNNISSDSLQQSTNNTDIFSKQVDEVLNGNFPQKDMLIVSQNTPKILQDIGLNDLPITLTQRHLKTIMNASGEYKGANYHNLGVDLVKQLPQAIANPLNVLKSNTDSNSIVVITELADKQDRPVIASIKIDGRGQINNIEIDTNVLTSAYGKDNYDSFMKKNIANGNMLYDIDEGVTKKSGGKLQLRPTTSTLETISRLQLPNNSSKLSENNISQSNENVKSDTLPKYSMQNNENNTQERLDNNYKATGTRTDMQSLELPTINKETKVTNKTDILPKYSDSSVNLLYGEKNTKNLNPNEISKLTSEDANTTPKLPIVNRNKVNDGTSKFWDNINDKTNMLNGEQKNSILSEKEVKYYDTITNRESLEQAFKKLNEDGKKETNTWFSKNSEHATAVDVAEGWILLKQYADSGDTDGMVAVAKKMRDMGTKTGQTMQAFNIMERLTPEGMVKYAQSELSEAYDQMVKNKSKDWIDKYRADFDLSPQEVQFIIDNMKDVSKMQDDYNKKVKLAEIQKILTDKLPPDRGAGIKAWMRISMLFNPKTQVRNVMGNAVIAPVNYFSDLFASGMDKLVSKKTGVRTTGITNVKNYVKGFKQGLYESYNDFKKGINTRNIEGNRFEVTEGKSFSDKNVIGKNLNRVDNLLGFMLDAGDRGFYEATFTNSINNQKILNKTDVVTQEMIDIATKEALSRTWQDSNGYTNFVLNIRKGLNKVNVKGYGLGDVLIPFAKTPANLTKAIIDYSPAGLVNTLINGKNLLHSFSNGQYNSNLQYDFVQNLGKATAGSMLYVLGYALAKTGILSGDSDDDKDVSNFMKNTLGINSYSIKIGGKTFTYDWAQPVAAPFSIMANYVQKRKNNPNTNILENIISSLDVAGNILLEQSFMDSINTVLNNNDGFVSGLQESVMELPSRAIPTLMKQIVDLTDSTQRQTYSYDKPLETMKNKVLAKIPGLSKSLAPSVDTLGREIQRYGGKNNIFNVFLNPANVNTENISESAKEIYKIYKATGDNTVMPKQVAYYINKNGEKIVLTNEQRAEYQKISGKLIEESVSKIMGQSSYENMNDESKADTLSNVVNYSYEIAKGKVLNQEISDTYKKAHEYSKIGDVSDYYIFKNNIDNTDSETKKTSIVNYLTKSNNLSDKQIAFMYGNYYSSEKVLNTMIDLEIPIKEFIKYNSQEFGSDYNEKGVISNSRKNKVFDYINGLNLNSTQRAILFKMEYNSFSNYDASILKYIEDLDINKFDKSVLAKKIGFSNYDEYLINYIKSLNISDEEKKKKLENLGFTVKNNRVYR